MNRPKRTIAVSAARSRRARLAAITTTLGLLGLPAGASAHGFYDWGNPGATAPDGHYIVAIDYTVPTAPAGWGTGQLIGDFSCRWSDGSVDSCEGVADYF